jgi:hypothetical protein
MTAPISLAEERQQRFLRDLERGKHPALAAGSAPVRELMVWMEDGGMLAGDVIALLIHTAATRAWLGLDSPEQAEQFVRDTLVGWSPSLQTASTVSMTPSKFFDPIRTRDAIVGHRRAPRRR